MIIVIIAGGSGTRLWPLSTPQFPKHLLNLTGKESLLQGTYRRAKQLSKYVYVITVGDHADKLKAQLPELPEDAFVIEPGLRGTASCLVAGLHHIQSRHDHDEPIAFIAADHYIRDTHGFVQSFKVAAAASAKNKKVVIFGVEPTFPSTGFGYIHKATTPKDDSLVYEVVGFKEKPSFEVAQQYMNSGDYLWNCSYFIGSVNTFLRDMQQFSPAIKNNYDQLLATKDKQAYQKTYLSFTNTTIDYALCDLVTPGTFLVMPANFDWRDLGSFQDVHEVASSDATGNYTQGDNVAVIEATNSLIRNDEPGKPVAVIGLDNVVVINTPQGLLVARKDLSQRVKDATQLLQK